MSTIYERIKNETEVVLMKECGAEPANLKGCTVRLLPEYIQLIDKLAENLTESRQVFLSALIYDAVDEALNAYASVFQNPSRVMSELRESCGFIYGDATESQFVDFCRLNNLHPDDPGAMSTFQDAVDYVKERDDLAKEIRE